MTEIETQPNQAAALRREAEKIVRENADLSPQNLLTLSHAYSAHPATRIRRNPPPWSDPSRQGDPVESATPGRSEATLVF